MFIALLTFASPAAFAQAPAGSGQESRADDLYREGKKAYEEGRLEDARAAFEGAWAVKKSFDIAGNLGAVELKMHRARDAAEHLSYSLRLFPVNGKPEAKQKTIDFLNQARALVATVVVTTNAPNADVFVDGRLVGRAPLEGELYAEPGHHVIEARLTGYEVAKEAVDVPAGASRDVRLSLQLEAGGGGTPGISKAWLVAGGALAGAGLGVGIGSTVAANGKASDVKRLQGLVGSNTSSCAAPNASLPNCVALSSAASGRDTFTNVAMGAFIGAGVVGAGTVALWIWDSSRRSSGGTASRAQLVLSGGPRQAGAVVTGTW